MTSYRISQYGDFFRGFPVYIFVFRVRIYQFNSIFSAGLTNSRIGRIHIDLRVELIGSDMMKLYYLIRYAIGMRPAADSNPDILPA